MIYIKKPIIIIPTMIIVTILLFVPTSMSMIQLNSHDPYFLDLFKTSEKELHLLRVEHYLELEASEDTNPFHVSYVFPPIYGYKLP